MIILFFADVVGKPGREALISKLPALKERYGADAVVANGENATDGKGIKPAHAEALLERRRRRHHHRQPRLEAARRLPLPRRAAPHRPALQLPRLQPGQGRHRRRHPRRPPGRGQPERPPLPLPGALAVRGRRRGPGAAARGAQRPRRSARRGHQREGGHGLVPGRPGERRRRHAHPRPHRRRARPARRHRLHHRRGHVRPPRLGHRRQEGTGPRALPDAAAGPLRSGRRRRVAGRRGRWN